MASETKINVSGKKLWMIGMVLIAIFVAGSAWWWVRSNGRVSTDDARVKATMTTVSPKVPGRVAELLLQEGDQVEAGQTIAILEQAEYQNQTAQAEANLAATKAKLAALIAGNRRQEIIQADAKVAQEAALYRNERKNYDRSSELYAQNAISSQQLDAARASFKSTEAQYQSSQAQSSLTKEGARPEEIALAEAMVRQAEAVLANAKLQLADTVVKAPTNGTIGMRSAELGENVAAGQPLYNITNLDDVWIGSNIEESFVGKIKLGNRVEFTVDAYSGVTFTGEVIEAGPAASSQFALLPEENTAGNFTKVTQRLPIKIKPDAGEYTLKPGMSAIVTVFIK